MGASSAARSCFLLPQYRRKEGCRQILFNVQRSKFNVSHLLLQLCCAGQDRDAQGEEGEEFCS